MSTQKPEMQWNTGSRLYSIVYIYGENWHISSSIRSCWDGSNFPGFPLTGWASRLCHWQNAGNDYLEVVPYEEGWLLIIVTCSRSRKFSRATSHAFESFPWLLLSVEPTIGGYIINEPSGLILAYIEDNIGQKIDKRMKSLVFLKDLLTKKGVSEKWYIQGLRNSPRRFPSQLRLPWRPRLVRALRWLLGPLSWTS